MINIGDKITLTSSLQGVVKFIGEIKDKDGIWVGLELNKPKGKNNGKINDVEYFKCKDNFGVFFRKQYLMDKIQKTKISNIDNHDVYRSDNDTNLKNSDRNLEMTTSIDFKNEDDYERTVQNIIDKNTSLSKIIDLKKKYGDLKISNLKTINTLQNEIKELKEENKKLKEENLEMKNLKHKFEKTEESSFRIKNFVKEAHEIIQEMLDVLISLEKSHFSKNISVQEENEYFKLCDVFKSVIFSVMENDSEEFNNNVEKYKNKIKNLKK